MIQSLISLIFIAASAAVVYLSGDFKYINQFLRISPLLIWAFSGLTFIVCLRFNKSRLSFLLALFLLCYFKKKIPYISAIPQNEFMAFIACNTLFLTNSNERGVFSIHGLNKMILIFVQLGLIYYFTVFDNIGYRKSGLTAIRTVRWALNLPHLLFPLVILLIAAIKNIVRDRTHDISFALGTMAGFIVLYVWQVKVTELNMVAVVALMFIGAMASIYTLSYIDELTGLPGRRSYNDYTASLGSKYTLAISDIDHFKKFNDTYGHDTGDEVLKLVARVLSTVGGGGKTFRLGGEEFVIVFTGKRKEKTAVHLEDIRKKIEKTPFTVRNRKSRNDYRKTGVKTKPSESKKIRITMSFGASDSWSGENLASVMKAADAALYKSKKRGRNRVTI